MAMNLNNFKKSITVATVLTIAACLVPESAQAIILKFSGSPNAGETFVDFTINTSIKDSNPAPNKGLFKGAVQEATFTCSPDRNPSFNCTRKGEIFSFNSGDLTASLTSNNTVQYEATLFDAASNVLTVGLLISPSGSNFNTFDLINSLSNLNQVLAENPRVLQIAGQFQSQDPGAFLAGVTVITITPPPVTAVPEPDEVGSLLGTGAISTLLLLKRSRRSRKLTRSTTAPQ